MYARENVTIGAGETVLVPLGVKIDLNKLIEENEPLFESSRFGIEGGWIDSNFNKDIFNDFLKSHQLNLHIRSSLSAKYGLIIANGTGIIDLDYEDEIMICLHSPIIAVSKLTYLNFQRTLGDFQINRGDKVAQISLVEHKTYLMGIDTTKKRTGGFGSTGK